MEKCLCADFQKLRRATHSCSVTARPTLPIFGNFWPMNIVAKTMLIRNPGIAFQPSCQAGGMRVPQEERIARPIAPPMMDDGK